MENIASALQTEVRMSYAHASDLHATDICSRRWKLINERSVISVTFISCLTMHNMHTSALLLFQFLIKLRISVNISVIIFKMYSLNQVFALFMNTFSQINISSNFEVHNHQYTNKNYEEILKCLISFDLYDEASNNLKLIIIQCTDSFMPG
jgi:hypothetical protein